MDMDIKEKAVFLKKEGFTCASAVFSVFAPSLGVDEIAALKIGDGFGGGMRFGSVCGAVAGAIMVISLKYGRTIADDEDSKQQVCQLVEQLRERFKSLHGHLDCQELLGLNPNTPEGNAEAERKGLFDNCPKFVEDCVAILQELPAEQK